MLSLARSITVNVKCSIQKLCVISNTVCWLEINEDYCVFSIMFMHEVRYCCNQVEVGKKRFLFAL